MDQHGLKLQYQTANINNVEDEEIILDKTFLSLGIDKGDGIMEIIIPRNTKIPFEKTITLKSINNSSFNYKIYEGERKLVKYNMIIILMKKQKN